MFSVKIDGYELIDMLTAAFPNRLTAVDEPNCNMNKISRAFGQQDVIGYIRQVISNARKGEPNV